MDSCISQKEVLNPEFQERRCRVCYQTSFPLLSLCQCSGSIAFVHEDCILDWITKKMEQNPDNVHIPKCEICKAKYSATMVVGSKKICPKLVFQKIQALPTKEILQSIFYLIGVLLAAYFILFMSFRLLDGQIQLSFSQIVKSFIFPGAFIYAGVTHAEKRRRIAQESIVQIVEVTLHPKITIK